MTGPRPPGDGRVPPSRSGGFTKWKAHGKMSYREFFNNTVYIKKATFLRDLDTINPDCFGNLGVKTNTWQEPNHGQ